MKLTDPAGRREIINVYPFASPSLHSPASLASFPPPAVLSSNLRRQNNRDEENVVSNFGHCSHGNDWDTRREEEGEERDRVEHMCKTNLSIIGGSETISGISAINGDTFLRARSPTRSRTSPPPHPSDTSVCNLRTGSPRQAGSPPKRRLFYFVTH